MKKYLILASLTLLIGGVSFAQGAGFITVASGGQVTFASGGQITTPAPTSTITIKGYSTHPTISSTCGANATYYQRLLSTGATEQRTDLEWRIVQSTSSASYVWGGYDCAVDDASALGISTVFIINLAPNWAGYNSCTGYTNCPPVDTATLSTFCTAAATHFLGRVSAFEVWNEPNGTAYSKGRGMANYYVDLNACYAAIKAVSSSITVISAGLMPASTVASTSTSIPDSIDIMFAGSPTYDVMGAHPYSYPWGLTTGDQTSNAWQALLYTRQAMNSHGHSAKRIWITEVGAPTCGPGNVLKLGDSSGSSGDYMSLNSQKALAAQIVATSTASGNAWLGVDKYFWYTLIDSNSSDHSDRENCFGALYTNGSPKPIFEVLRNL